jgi:hypothetical protein
VDARLLLGMCLCSNPLNSLLGDLGSPKLMADHVRSTLEADVAVKPAVAFGRWPPSSVVRNVPAVGQRQQSLLGSQRHVDQIDVATYKRGPMATRISTLSVDSIDLSTTAVPRSAAALTILMGIGLLAARGRRVNR